MGCCLPTDNTGVNSDLENIPPRPNNVGNSVNSGVPGTNDADGAKATKTSKVIFMGNQNVGKTSMINCFMEKNNMRGRDKPLTNVIQDFTKVVSVQDDQGARH